MAEIPKLSCGNQHSGLTCEGCQGMERHFKVEPDQNMDLCKALAVKLQLGDIKREPTVKDPKREKNKMKLQGLPLKPKKKLRNSVLKTWNNSIAPKSRGCPWSLYYHWDLCKWEYAGQLNTGARRISLRCCQNKSLKEGGLREQSSQKASPGLPETLKALEKLKLSSEYC